MSIEAWLLGAKLLCHPRSNLTARSGFKIDNDFVVEIAYYRAGTTVWDGFIVLFFSLLTFVRWAVGLSKKVTWDGPRFEKAYFESKRLWKGRSGSSRGRK